MAFVNEIVSEKDAQNFGLDELKREFDQWAWRDGRPEGFVHAWTIDNEHGIWLVLVKSIEEVGPSGRPEPTTKSVFILDWNGLRIRFLMDRVSCSSSFSDTPFHVVWNLIEMDAPTALGLPRDAVLSALKEALIAYGYRGAHRQVPNTLVEFKFSKPNGSETFSFLKC